MNDQIKNKKDTKRWEATFGWILANSLVYIHIYVCLYIMEKVVVDLKMALKKHKIKMYLCKPQLISDSKKPYFERHTWDIWESMIRP